MLMVMGVICIKGMIHGVSSFFFFFFLILMCVSVAQSCFYEQRQLLMHKSTQMIRNCAMA